MCTNVSYMRLVPWTLRDTLGILVDNLVRAARSGISSRQPLPPSMLQ